MTHPNVESPVMGGKLRASWGASVSSAIDAHEADLQALRQPGKWESLRAGDDAPLAPFAVRLHKTKDDEDGQWEIYLPPGCCNVGGTCEPMNTKASEKSGHEEDDASWYRFDFDQSMEYATEDGDGNQTNRFVVSAHAKTSAKEYGVDEIDAPARRLLWIGVMDFNRANDAGGEESYPDSVRYKDTPGDTWSCVVAEIRATRKAEQEQSGEGAEETKWSVVQRRTTPVDVALPAGAGVSGFDLVWNLAVGSDGKLEVKALYSVRQNVSAAGFSLTGDSMTDVLDAETVYARIGTSLLYGSPSNVVEVLKDPEGVNVPSPDVVWLHLYDLKRNTVTADHRPQSLVNLQLFHA